MKTLKIIIGFVGILLSFGTVIKLSLTEPTHASMCILSMTLGVVVVLFFLLLTNSMAEYTNPKTPGLPKFDNPHLQSTFQKEELPIIKIRVERKISAIEYQQLHKAIDVEKYAEGKMERQLIQQLLDNNLIYQTKNESNGYTYLLWELNVIMPKKIFTYERDKNSVSGLGVWQDNSHCDVHSKVKGYHEGGQITNKNEVMLPNKYRDEMTNKYREEK